MQVKFWHTSLGFWFFLSTTVYISVSTTETPLNIFLSNHRYQMIRAHLWAPLQPLKSSTWPSEGCHRSAKYPNSKLSFQNYWLLSFHDIISTLHSAKIFFYHVIFNFNSNDRDVLTQSLLTLWSRIDFLDILCSTNYFEVGDQQEVLSSATLLFYQIEPRKKGTF